MEHGAADAEHDAVHRLSPRDQAASFVLDELSSRHGRHRPLGSTSTREVVVASSPPRVDSRARSTPRTRVKNPSMMTSEGGRTRHSADMSTCELWR